MSGIAKITQNRNDEKTNLNTDWLSLQLDKALNNASDKENVKGVFYASSLGRLCDRFLYMHYNGILPVSNISSQLRRIFDHGNATQYRYRKYFEKMRALISEETIARIDNPPIHGRADFVLSMSSNDNNDKQLSYKKFILELKTINDSGFNALSKPKEDHEIQLQTYLNILHIDNGAVLYENKNDQKIKVFYVNKDGDKWKAIIDRCRKIMGMSNIPELNLNDKGHDKYCPCLG